MTSSNGNISHVIGPLCGEFIGHRWISLIKASDMELGYLLLSAPEQTVMQTIETQVSWDAIALIITSLQCSSASLKWNHVHISFYLLHIRKHRSLQMLPSSRVVSVEASLSPCMYKVWHKMTYPFPNVCVYQFTDRIFKTQMNICKMISVLNILTFKPKVLEQIK